MIHSGGTVANSKLKVIDCTYCGFCHLDPIPDNRKYYKRQFLLKDKPNYLKQMEANAMWNQIHFKIELDAAENFAGKAGELLDIGAGFGHFMQTAGMRGWQVHGIEPSDEGCKHLKAKGLDFEQGIFEEIGVEKESVDLIRMAWVLEHVQDPEIVLLKAWRCLKPNSYLLVVVPNDFSNLQRLTNRVCFKKEYWVDHSHINYFTPSTLAMLLKKCGFSLVGALSTFPMELFILMGLDYTHNRWFGNVAHKIRTTLEETMARLEPDLSTLVLLGSALYRIGMGRDLVCFFKKE